MNLSEYFLRPTADSVATDQRGWSFNLAIFRIVFLIAGALPWAIRNLHWADQVLVGLPTAVWTPISFYRWIPYSILSNVALVEILAILNLALILLGILGLYTRLALGGATILSLYLFGLMENMGKVDHYHHVIWFMAILAAGPSGRFLSIDAIRNSLRRADAGMTEESVATFDALWTLRYGWILLGMLYFIPGIAKLHSALTVGWASPANLQHIIWRKWFESVLFDAHARVPIRLDLLPPRLLELASFGVIVFEISFIFFVLFRRARPILALAGIGFHIGNGLGLGIWFTTLFPAYVMLIDWVSLGQKILPRRGPLLVFYDDCCSMCRRTVAVLGSFDLLGQMKLRPVSQTMEFTAEHSELMQAELRQDLYVLEGSRISAGYEAYVRISSRVLLFWPFSVLLRIPAVANYGRKIYRRVADHRNCALVPVTKHQLDTQSGTLSWVHPVGIGLLLCQFAISGMVFANDELPGFTKRLPRLANRALVHVVRSRPLWPFAPYPTFSGLTSEDVTLWEVRWVSPKGEVRASPLAYTNAFNNSAMVWNLVTRFPSEPAPEGLTNSREVVFALWQNESPEIRSASEEARVYQVHYKLIPGDPPAKAVDATLVGSFALTSNHR
jgi:predicted DCC family thiol-disulfide oxidoreductase YuxK